MIRPAAAARPELARPSALLFPFPPASHSRCPLIRRSFSRPHLPPRPHSMSSQTLRLQAIDLSALSPSSLLPSPTAFFGANSSFPTSSPFDFQLFPSALSPAQSDPSTPPSYSSDRESSPATSYLGTPGASPILSHSTLPLHGGHTQQQYAANQGYYLATAAQPKPSYSHPPACLSEIPQHEQISLGRNEVRVSKSPPHQDQTYSRIVFPFSLAQSYPVQYSTAEIYAAQAQSPYIASQAPVAHQQPPPVQQHQHYSALSIPMMYHQVPQLGHSPPPPPVHQHYTAPPAPQQQFYSAAPQYAPAVQQQQMVAPVQQQQQMVQQPSQAIAYSYPAPSFETPQGTYYFVPNSSANAVPVILAPAGLVRGHSAAASVGSAGSWSESDEMKPGQKKGRKMTAGKNQTKRFVSDSLPSRRVFIRARGADGRAARTDLSSPRVRPRLRAQLQHAIAPQEPPRHPRLSVAPPFRSRACSCR